MNNRQREQYKTFNNSLNKFCSRYRATAKQGRPMRRSQPLSYKDWMDDKQDFFSTSLNMFEVPTVELTISEDDFKELLNEVDELDSDDYREYLRLTKALGEHFVIDLYSLRREKEREERVRNANPGVQKAWENYQLMLKLAGG